MLRVRGSRLILNAGFAKDLLEILVVKLAPAVVTAEPLYPVALVFNLSLIFYKPWYYFR